MQNLCDLIGNKIPSLYINFGGWMKNQCKTDNFAGGYKETCLVVEVQSIRNHHTQLAKLLLNNGNGLM
jgi:hypothetical protein